MLIWLSILFLIYEKNNFFKNVKNLFSTDFFSAGLCISQNHFYMNFDIFDE